MSKRSRNEYLSEIRLRYRVADKCEKKKILDEFCEVCSEGAPLGQLQQKICNKGIK